MTLSDFGQEAAKACYSYRQHMEELFIYILKNNNRVKQKNKR